jgi:hypothetical protein
MPAELLEQLRALGDVLDEVAPAVRVDELAGLSTITGPIGTVAPATVTTDPGPTHYQARWLVRVTAAIAAVVAIVAIAAMITSREGSDGSNGSPTSASASVQTTTPAVLNPNDVEPGSKWLATAAVPGGTVEVVQSPDGQGICLWFTWGVPVYTAIVNGVATDGHAVSYCTDANLVATGRLYTVFRPSNTERGVLIGFTATDIGFTADVAGTKIRPDSHGLWYAPEPTGSTTFSISTNNGTAAQQLPVDPFAGPTFVATTTAPADATIAPADDAPSP